MGAGTDAAAVPEAPGLGSLFKGVCAAGRFFSRSPGRPEESCEESGGGGGDEAAHPSNAIPASPAILNLQSRIGRGA
jgi:hypothetical protein